MNRKQFRRIAWIFLILTIMFYINNMLYGCNAGYRETAIGVSASELPLSEYAISCLVAREVNSALTSFCLVLFIGFFTMSWLEPKEKK